MANTLATTAFISLNDIINNFIISYTGPGKLIPDSKRTEVIFHARRCLQEFAYETLKSKFTITDTVMPSGDKLILPNDFVTTIQVGAKPTSTDPFVVFTQVAYVVGGIPVQPIVNTNEFSIEYSSLTNDGKDVMHFSSNNSSFVDFELTYLSNALTTDESAAIPKLAEEALYACMVYAILANREKTNPNTLQRLLIEKIDKLERSKSRLIFTNFSE
jgi:hypothetical protein